MKEKNMINLKGTVLIERRKKDGTIIDKEKLDNLIVNDGRERVAKLLCGVLSGSFGFIGIGTGATPPAISQTALQTQVKREDSTESYEADYKAIFEHTFTFGIGESYTITEAGVFSLVSGGVMLDRFTFSGKMVDSDTDLYVKVTITIS
jgi:hypothetical protein